MNDKQIKQINKQIKNTYQKAFFDLLEQKVADDPPDYEWITRLYAEIRQKLISILKKESPLRKELEEHLDIELFNQMISNKAFDPKDLYNLICYTFDTCKKLGSPARDKETDLKKQEIIELANSDKGTFATVVPLFIKNINYCIDNIYEDLRNLRNIGK